MESDKDKEDIPSSSTSSTSSPSNKRKRKYVENFLEFGFTSIFRNNEQLPVCVLCKKSTDKRKFKSRQTEKTLGNSAQVRFFQRY